MKDLITKLKPIIHQLNFLVDSLTEESEDDNIHLRTMGNYAIHLRDKADKTYKLIEVELNRPIEAHKKVLTGKLTKVISEVNI